MILSGGGLEPIDPHLKRWMLFVDGENLAIRGQHFFERQELSVEESPRYKRDVFMWFGNDRHVTRSLSFFLRGIGLREAAERAIYYTSVFGDTDAQNGTREALWDLGFTPEVFKKRRKGEKAKGVDIALTKDLLSNAFLNNYDVAVVITGDADFPPVIDELKRLGKTICLLAFTEGKSSVSQELKLSSDYFISLDSVFTRLFAAKGIIPGSRSDAATEGGDDR